MQRVTKLALNLVWRCCKYCFQITLPCRHRNTFYMWIDEWICSTPPTSRHMCQ